jgi:hypothetical protein
MRVAAPAVSKVRKHEPRLDAEPASNVSLSDPREAVAQIDPDARVEIGDVHKRVLSAVDRVPRRIGRGETGLRIVTGIYATASRDRSSPIHQLPVVSLRARTWADLEAQGALARLCVYSAAGVSVVSAVTLARSLARARQDHADAPSARRWGAAAMPHPADADTAVDLPLDFRPRRERLERWITTIGVKDDCRVLPCESSL